MITILIFNIILLTQLYLVCRNKTVNIRELFQLFFVGATGAVLISFLFQGIAVRIWGQDFVYYAVGPIIEEVVKISFLVFLLFKTRVGKTTGIEDGLLLGAALGAGFGFSEDVVRAAGLGIKQTLEYFPAYDLKNLWSLLTTWLPNERQGGYMVIQRDIFVAGHLLWTALVGVGLGIARKIPVKFKWRYLIPLFLLILVMVDHSLVNNQESFLRSVYDWYGRGWGIKYAITFLIIAAVIADEMILRRNFPPDKKFLLPGEKKRSLLNELRLILTIWKFGKKYWLEAVRYFGSRRQFGFLVSGENDTTSFGESLIKRRQCVIASAVIAGVNPRPVLPAGINYFWRGPHFNFFQFNWKQKMWWLFGLIMLAIFVFNIWLFLFSAYFSGQFVAKVYQSRLFMVLGVAGYLMAVFEIFIYYKKKLWQGLENQEPDNRIKKYSHPLLIHFSGLTAVFCAPSFFGKNPLLINKFFWGQLARFFEQLGEARKWIGGTVSAAIGLIPIAGNVKSGFDAAFGYDYIADKPVEGLDRVFAVVGAVPLVGNLIRSGRYGYKFTRFVRFRKVVKGFEEFDDTGGKVMGKYGLGVAVKDDLVHAFGEVREQIRKELSQTRAKDIYDGRINMLKQWSNQGGLERRSEGVYALPFSGKNVEVYIGREGISKLGIKNKFEGVGQISIDNASQSIMFDNINPDYAGVKSAGSKVQIEALQKKYSGYTILHRKVFADGFSETNVISPDGKSSSFLSVSSRRASLGPTALSSR